SLPFYLTNVSGTLFFAARDNKNHNELWRSDGTDAGTVLVKDLYPPPGPYGYDTVPVPTQLTNVNGTLFFVARDLRFGPNEIWKSDGTTAGTVLVKAILPNRGNAYLASLTALNGALVFT